MECPLIYRDIEPNPAFIAFNVPINYRDLGGTDYIFYDHDDGSGKITRVQFCTLIGRKRDILQCLNEGEWRKCPHYLQAALAKQLETVPRELRAEED